MNNTYTGHSAAVKDALVSVSARQFAKTLRGYYNQPPSLESDNKNAHAKKVTISHQPGVRPRPLPEVERLTPKQKALRTEFLHTHGVQPATNKLASVARPLSQKMIAFANDHNIPLRRITDWRWVVDQRQGQIQGLPRLRGRLVMTDGVLAILIGEDETITWVHYEWFVPDPRDGDSANRGDNLAAARSALAAKRAAKADAIAHEALALFERLKG
jgi:hypothetical protein